MEEGRVQREVEAGNRLQKQGRRATHARAHTHTQTEEEAEEVGGRRGEEEGEKRDAEDRNEEEELAWRGAGELRTLKGLYRDRTSL